MPEPHTAVIIFSRDRALQLEATLRSLIWHVQDIQTSTISVLFSAGSPLHARQYRQLARDFAPFGFVRFVEETSFRSDLLALIAPSGYLLFLVDDNIFIRNFTLARLREALAGAPEAIGFSLRLGRNTRYCYSLDAPQTLPSFREEGEGVLSYLWPGAEHDFGYVLEVSSSLYRSAEMLELLNRLPFKKPNSLEAVMAEQCASLVQRRPRLFCCEHALTFCAPINNVQDEIQENRIGGRASYGVDALAELFDAGWRVDIMSYQGISPDACHFEVELNLLEPPSPLVSIVIPCYNQACYLADAVTSVINQTYTAWECLIVNDGSPDDTSGTARELIAAHPDQRLRLLEKENGGLADARNFGITQAKGKYVLPLDADDILHPEMLAKTVRFLEQNHEVAITYTDLIHFGAVQKHVVAGEYDFDRLRYANQLNYCSLYRRKIWEEVGGYNRNMTWGYEDWDFWIGCGERGYFAAHLPEALLFYRVKDQSMFTKALEHDAELKARIVLNHPDIYSQQERDWARQMLNPAGPHPLVSVIVPTYNRPKLLCDALRSILDQSFQDFEIIVVNDAGTDVSSALASMGEPSRLRLVPHETNRGLAATRNSGLAAATGKYIAYLDDDDVFYPEHLATLVERLESDGSFVAYTDAHRVHLEDCDGVATVIGRDIPFSDDFDYHRILFDNFIPVLCVMHRRECLEQVGVFDPLLHRLEDWDLWIRVSRHYQFQHIPKVTCAFSWHTGGGATMTSANREPFEWAMLRVSHKRRDLLPQVPAAAAWQAEFVSTAAARLSAALDSALAARRYDPRAIFGTDDMAETLSCASQLADRHPEHRDQMTKLQERIEVFASLRAKDGAAAPREAGPTPLVSVIVPTFNRPETLRMALDSILAQSFTDFEIVVVNDAGNEVDSVLGRFPQGKIVYLRHEVNRGLAAARNTGIKAARGRYIAYLDDDDLYYPDHLETLVRLLQREGSQVAYTDAFCALQHLEQGRYRTAEKKVIYSCDFDYRRILVENFIPVLCIMHEKSCLDLCGPFDESLKRHEDWDLWIRMSRHFRFTHLARATCEYTFRTDGSGMTSGTLPTFLVSMRYIYRKYAQELAQDNLLRERQKHALTQLKLSIFSFLGERLAPFGSLSALPFQELQQIGATRPQILSAYYYLQAAKSSDTNAKILLLEKALGECEENLQSCMDLVTLHIEAGEYLLASKRLTLLEEADPGNEEFAQVRDLLAEKVSGCAPPSMPTPSRTSGTGTGKEALGSYLGRLERDPDDTEALLNVGRICASEGRTEDARLLYDKILALAPQHPGALEELARVSGQKPAVSIIIPLLNQVELTRGCLERMAETTNPILFELILVDNGSSDGTGSYLATLPPSVKVVSNAKNLGFAKACNQGAALAQGRYLLFLNNDTEPRPGWLEPLLALLDADPAVVAAGSKLLFPDGTIQHAGVIMAKVHATGDHLVPTHIYYKRPADQPEANVATCYQALTAACLAVRREQFIEVGGFDEGYWNGYEDVDLCLKLGRNGAKLVYQPESVLVHLEAQSGTERSARGHENIRRLHEKWLGKIPIDFEIATDGTLAETSGLHPLYIPPRHDVEVSIVIPAFNQAGYTKRCLEAIFEVTGGGISFEVIVVNNASSDWTLAYLKGMEPQIRVLSNARNLGFAKACNQGALAARGRYVVFLNNDTVPKPGWLGALVRGSEIDGADVVGAKLLYPDGTVQHAGVGFDDSGLMHVFKGMPGDHPAANRKRIMQCVTGACLLIGRQLFLDLGCFDEGFLNGYEDLDLCLRAQAAGKKILYAPESVLVHFEETTPGRKDNDQQNAERFAARWGGSVRCDVKELYDSEGLFRPIGDQRADQCYETLGANDNAVFIYLNVLRRHPADTGALLNLARSCAASGRSEDAWAFMERILQIRPDHPAALQRLTHLTPSGGYA